jgi:hypothetical protein
MADSFDILHPGPWFGPRSTTVDHRAQTEPGRAQARLLELAYALKNGRFETRPDLESFILGSKDPAVRRQAIRLYCYTARHEDIAFLGKVAEQFDHDEAETIAVTAPDTLSPAIMPYLLALMEIYADTSIETNIVSSINILFPFGYTGEQPVTLHELGDRFADLAHKLEPGGYYFGGVLAFPGDWTKELMTVAARCRHDKTKFPLARLPALLSICSGELCPVTYGDVIDDAAFERIIGYIKGLAAGTWRRGMKYFYSYPVA